jgi:indolepyruvate ferredoxin oxidoreductase alpha subunit
VVLDNSGTAMTGFQPHPGLDHNVLGDDVPAIDVAKYARRSEPGSKSTINFFHSILKDAGAVNEPLKTRTGVKVLIRARPAR